MQFSIKKKKGNGFEDTAIEKIEWRLKEPKYGVSGQSWVRKLDLNIIVKVEYDLFY